MSDDLRELGETAARVAEAMRGAGDVLPRDVRQQFIDVRARLFRRGIYDPVLVRFDSATAPKAPVSEIAAQLATVSQSLA